MSGINICRHPQNLPPNLISQFCVRVRVSCLYRVTLDKPMTETAFQQPPESISVVLYSILCHVMLQLRRQPPWGSYRWVQDHREAASQRPHVPWRAQSWGLLPHTSHQHAEWGFRCSCSMVTLGQGSKIILAIYLLIKAVLHAWGLHWWRHQESAMLTDSQLDSATVGFSYPILFWILMNEWMNDLYCHFTWVQRNLGALPPGA